MPPFEPPAPPSSATTGGTGRRGGLGNDLAVFAVLLAVSAVVHAPYVDAYFYFDDMNHLEAVSRVHAGLDSWSRFLSSPHNEHMVPLFRAWWYATWRVCGIAYHGWAWQSIAVHGFSACTTYLLARRFLESRVGAFAGAATWAAAALGGFDNQILWLAALHTAMGWTMLLAATACAADAGTPRARRAAARFAACLLAAVLLQSSLVICLAGPAVPVVRRWRAARRLPGSGRELSAWGLAWGVPVLVGALLQVAALRQVETMASASGALAEPARFLAWFSLTMLRATGAPFGLPAIDPAASEVGVLPYAAVAAVLGAAVAKTVRPHGGELLLAIAAAALPMTAAAVASRIYLDASLILTFGRYQYAATLGACAAVGVVVDGLARRAAAQPIGRRRLLAGAGIAAAILVVAVQRRAAERTLAVAAIGGFDLTRQQAAAYVGALDRLSERGIVRRVPVEVPDLACNVGNMPNRLSAFARIARPEGLPGIRFEEPSRIDWRIFRSECREAGVNVLNEE